MGKIVTFMVGLMALLAIPSAALALPVPSEAEFRVNHSGLSGGAGVLLGYQVFSNKEQLLRCRYDVSVSGGSSAAAINLRAVDGSKCYLPDNAIVRDTLIDVLTAPTSYGGYGTVAFGTGESASDIKAAMDTGGASGINHINPYAVGLLAGIPVGTAATSIKLTAARNPIATVAVKDLSTGKFDVYIKYFLGQ